MQKKPNKPLKTFRQRYWGGGVRLMVWKSRLSYAFTIEKLYKDKNNCLVKTNTIYPNELALLNALIYQALAWTQVQDEYIATMPDGMDDDIVERKASEVEPILEPELEVSPVWVDNLQKTELLARQKEDDDEKESTDDHSISPVKRSKYSIES
jgi:hypothetical protein